MSRHRRCLLDGGYYYIAAHGYNGLELFRESADYERYLADLRYIVREHQLTLFHYCLVPRSVYLVITAAQAVGLSRALQQLQLRYAAYYRTKYHVLGHVWQGRFHSTLLEPGRWVLHCGLVIEWQSVLEGLTHDPAQYPWSSYRTYAEGHVTGPITLDEAYRMLGATDRERHVAYAHACQALAKQGGYFLQRLTQARYLGSPLFVQRMEAHFGLPGLPKSIGRPPKTAPAPRREIAPNPINLPLTATTPQRYRGDPAHRGRSVGSRTDNTREVP